MSQAEQAFKGDMPLQARALVLGGVKQPFRLEQITLGSVQAGEVLVRIFAAGICQSDLAVQSGKLPTPLPAILGHEGAGDVVEVGAGVERLARGDRVLLSFDHCGHCKHCSNKRAAGCPSFHPLNFSLLRPDGSTSYASSETHRAIAGRFFGQSSFSEYAIVAQNCCVKVAPDANLALLCPLGCGIQTGAGTILNILKPGKEHTLAVWGLGGVGLAAIMAAKFLGVGTIIAIDVVTSRREIAHEVGATHSIDGLAPDVVQQVQALSNGGLDFAVEATGIASCMKAAYDSLGYGGQYAQAGVPPPSDPPFNMLIGAIKGTRVTSVVEGDSHPPDFLPQLVKMVTDGDLPLERICKFYKVEEFEAAITAMLDGSTIKPVLLFGE